MSSIPEQQPDRTFTQFIHTILVAHPQDESGPSGGQLRQIFSRNFNSTLGTQPQGPPRRDGSTDLSCAMPLKRPGSSSGYANQTNDINAATTPKKKARREKQKPKPSVPLQKASIRQLASDENFAPSSNVEDHIVHRIQKCLDRANHPNTPEAEAKAALHLSSRLMSQYNIKIADVLAREKQEHRAQYGGSSVVSIRSTKGLTHRVVCQSFTHSLANAMGTFFDCKAYSASSFGEITCTFYGIAENTVTAARAFEMVHNRILEWACAHKGISASFSYCCGVANGLMGMADEEKKKERTDAKRKEEATVTERVRDEELHRQRELNRLKVVSGDWGNEHFTMSDSRGGFYTIAANDERSNTESTVSDNGSNHDSEYSFEYDDHFNWGDEDEEGTADGLNLPSVGNVEVEFEPDFKVEDGELLDPTADLDQEITNILNQKELPTRLPERTEVEVQKDHRLEVRPHKYDSNVSQPALWASEMQLVKFREAAEQVADDYLKAQGVKLSKGNSTQTTVKDFMAYSKGEKHSRKIDVRQKLVE